ncbi:hypothetical protein GCM10009837_24770 [Streptomyces durmitorensis]
MGAGESRAARGGAPASGAVVKRVSGNGRGGPDRRWSRERREVTAGRWALRAESWALSEASAATERVVDAPRRGREERESELTSGSEHALHLRHPAKIPERRLT